MIDGRATEGQKPGAVTGTAATLVLNVPSLAAEKSVANVKTSDGSEPMTHVTSDAGRDFAVGSGSARHGGADVHRGSDWGISRTSEFGADEWSEPEGKVQEKRAGRTGRASGRRAL